MYLLLALPGLVLVTAAFLVDHFKPEHPATRRAIGARIDSDRDSALVEQLAAYDADNVIREAELILSRNQG